MSSFDGDARRLLRWLLTTSLGIWLAAPGALAVPPAGFSNELIVGGLTEPIDMAFLPDGRALVLQKGGAIVIVELAASPPSASPYLLLPDVATAGELGLLAIALDPDFASNNYLYVYYAKASTGKLRLVRFLHQGNTANLQSEFLVWENPQETTACCHYGGGLDFGPDGRLYLTTGENFDAAQAQDLTRAGGKVIRLESNGMIPSDNPFIDGPGGNLDEIWAYGLRNPFRASWDLASGNFHIAEVGGNNQAVATEDIHLGIAGANYGWPICEGPCGDPLFEDPVFYYPHAGSGASITGGFAYRGSSFPLSFEGALFYGDFVRQYIRYVTFNPDGSVAGDFDFEDQAGSVVGMKQGPDGSLFYVEIWLGELRRISYQQGNQRPIIVQADASPTAGTAPLSATFTGVATDPESQPLSYRWFLGDGNESDGAIVNHDYASNGIYLARLRVSDGIHTVFSESVEIQVGTPPVVTITEPGIGFIFQAGETVNLAGSAVAGTPLVASNYAWNITFLHNEHIHPAVDGLLGPNASFFVEDSGHDFSDNTGFNLTLTVTDADGLFGSRTVTILPEKVDVTFQGNVPGDTIQLDGVTRSLPFVHDSLIGFHHEVATEVNKCINGTRYAFGSWSDGGGAIHEILIPANDSAITLNRIGAGPCLPRVSDGVQALYDFSSGSGASVPDRSGLSPALDLVIADPSNVSWLPGGGLVVNTPAIIKSAAPATRLRDAMLISESLSLEAWIVPAVELNQFGPARIVAYSENGNPNGGNFVLGQVYDSGSAQAGYAARLRTTETSQFGTPNLETPFGSATSTLAHLVYTRASNGDTRIYVDGVVRASATRTGALTVFDDLLLAVANEPTGARGWLGTLRLVAIYDRALDATEVDTNFLAGPDAPSGEPVAPSITIDPVDQVVFEGTPVSFSVAASGSPVLQFQWRRNGISLVGEVSPLLDLGAASLADDAALFDCVVSNAEGSATSAAATLTVSIAPLNDPPTANNDAYTLDEGGGLFVPATTGVLSNDTDPDGDPLEAVLVTPPSNGSLQLVADGSLLYVHDASETTSDAFVYEARDNIIGSDTATVMFTITPQNDPPTSGADDYVTTLGGNLVVDAPNGVLANDGDAEGASLVAQLVGDAGHGTLSLAIDGSFTYQHVDDGSTQDQFSYVAFDGAVQGPVTLVTIAFTQRVTSNLQALYDFQAGSGTSVLDRSGLAPALDLAITDPGAVSWLPAGGLVITTPTSIKTPGPATRLGDAIKLSEALTLEAWVTPVEELAQFGPARIITYSQDGSPNGGNFLLGQIYDGGSATAGFAARLRSTTTNQYGTPNLESPFGTATAALTHVVYTRANDGATSIFVNGSEAVTGLRAGTLTAFDDLPLTLADEPTGGRAWLGTLHLVAIYDRDLTPAEIQINFQAGPTPAAPPSVPTLGPAATTVLCAWLLWLGSRHSGRLWRRRKSSP